MPPSLEHLSKFLWARLEDCNAGRARYEGHSDEISEVLDIVDQVIAEHKKEPTSKEAFIAGFIEGADLEPETPEDLAWIEHEYEAFLESWKAKK